MSKVKVVSGEDEIFFPRMKRTFEIDKKYAANDIIAISYERYNKGKEIKALFNDRQWNYRGLNLEEVRKYEA